LLFSCLGGCPHSALAGDDRKPKDPPLAALLPSEQAWQITLPFSPSAPAAMDEARVYIPLQGEHFIAISRETGDTAWTVDIESDWPPLVNDGVVYIAASDELHALDAETGARKWRVPLGRGPMAPLTITQGTIIALVAPDEVWTFRSSDGQRLWLQPLGGSVGPASVAVTGARIFVGLGSRLVRLELSNGAVKWERVLPGVLRSPAVARDRVFVGSTGNQLYAVDQDNGKLDWSYALGGDVIGLATDASVVYVASLDNVLRALKQGSGNQIWKRALPTRPAAAPRAIGGVVAVPGITPPLSTFNAKTGAVIASLELTPDLQRAKFLAPTLIAPTLTPFTVSLVAITRDGRATGHRSVAMMFREHPLVPLAALPGKALTKERPPP
jgi:eukaryotic-like serine/threonine-protein kinase